MKYKADKIISQAPSGASKRATDKDDLGRRGASAESALGTNAESFAQKTSVFDESKGLGSNCLDTVYEHVDSETGEITPFKKNKFGDLVENISTDKIITERFLLQCSARHLMPYSRTAKCNRLSQKMYDDVGVLKSVEFNSISFSGLQTCGSPWACTLCAAKISERRKNEVIEALEKWLGMGGISYFLTFTFRHSKNDDLLILRKKQAKALGVLRASPNYKKYKKHVGYFGLIRALEVTWGQSNGWHPHTHEIIFAQNKVSFQSIKRLLFPEWVKACKKAGLAAPSFRRGIDVRGGDKAASYLSKYGDELTKGHLKKASGDRYSPFDLLRSYHYEKNKLHGRKFVEFAEGMQGSRQLYWTNGLKDLFSIFDKDDETLATEFLEERILLGYITHDHWRAIVKYEGRASIRILGRDYGLQAVIDLAAKHFEKFVSSGDMKKQDDKIAANREKYKKHVLPEQIDFLSKVDNRDVFEKLNEKIDLEKARLSSSVHHDLQDLQDFVSTLKYKLDDRDKRKDFDKLNYKNKKAQDKPYSLFL